jgi:predicted Zn-dependent peptidase
MMGISDRAQQAWIRLITVLAIFTICLLPFSNQPLAAATTIHADSSQVIKKVLANGLTILIKPSAANEVVVVDAFLRMGAIYETQNQRGISKLVQRILTKGTATRNAQDIVYQTESVGASIDANIDSYSYGSVSLKTTHDGFDTGLKVFLDVLLNPSFPEKEVIKEKQLMIEQLLTSTDQPTSVVFQNFLALFYGDHPMGMKPETISQNVATITREDILTWYHKIYTPSNMVISIVGQVDPDVIAKILQESLGKLAKGEEPTPVSAVAPSLEDDQQIMKTRDSQAVFMVLGYPTPEIASQDYPVMGVINYILGSDMGSRLFVELRDKRGLAYNVSTGYDAANYPTYIYAFMATAPKNYPEAKKGIIKEFRRLTTEPVPEHELEVAKVALKGGYLMGHETNADQSRFLGSYELLKLGYPYDDDYPHLIDKVTADDVLRVAAHYFKHYSLSAISPVEVKE